MSEQEIKQLAYLLEKAKGILTPTGKSGPDYIIVDNGVLVGTSFEIYNGVISDYKINEKKEVVVNHFQCY